MRIAVGSDHNGYKMKEFLLRHLTQMAGYECYDLGGPDESNIDYPVVALEAAEGIRVGSYDRAILVCGTGLGMAIAANKVPGVYAAPCTEVRSALASRQSNNAQILTLGAWLIGNRRAIAIVVAWLGSEFRGGISERKLQIIKEIEARYLLSSAAA